MSTTSALNHHNPSYSAIYKPSEMKFADTVSQKSAQSVYTLKKDEKESSVNANNASKMNQEEMQAFISSLASNIKTRVQGTIYD